MRNGSERGTESIGSAREGYTRCRSPQLVVGGSFGLDRPHGVGAGERRQRRTLIQSDGQTHQCWPNAFFAQAGLLALHTAWLNARHSR